MAEDPSTQTSCLARAYPEIGAGGFTSVDGTVEFYSRVNALLTRDMTVLDLGAGRGGWFEDDPCEFRKSMRLLKGKVRRVIGCDIDPVVHSNRAVDEVFVHDLNSPFPLPGQSVDVVVADYVFEHVASPEQFASEIGRVLKNGGWLCARTPSKWSYVAVASALIPPNAHSKILTKVQPGRKGIDVFPTAYRLNSFRDIRRFFPRGRYKNYSYFYAGEPSYHFGSSMILSITKVIEWLLPRPAYSNLFVFMQKIKDDVGTE